MNKIEFVKIQDIHGVWHWVNPQHVTEISSFQGHVMVRLSGDSFMLCDGDGRDCVHNIQQMIDYLTVQPGEPIGSPVPSCEVA